jgi:ubiquinone/menaquinone biosynthesis C-methylase UbiE
LLHRFLRFFFRLLYHQLAWSYDAVAAVVSLGRWNDWVGSAIPFVEGRRTLELAYGTGWLQVALWRQQPAFVTGIDESRQMARLAHHRLESVIHAGVNIIQARAQRLPYCAQAFDSIVATFPTEFIHDEDALHEVYRVLHRSGRFVIVAAAWIQSLGLLDRAAAWLFRSTRQSPALPPSAAGADYATPLERAGFTTGIHYVETRGSTVLVLVATR